MQDILEIISDMRELRQLYKTGELVEHDIQRLLNKWEKTFDEQEKIMEAQFQMEELFFKDTPFTTKKQELGIGHG